MDTFDPDDLTPEQNELLSYLLEDEHVGGEDSITILPHPAANQAPLSFAQQSLWLIDQLSPGNPVYNIPVALRLDGALDITALSRSVDALVARHAALRTTFDLREGRPGPVQVIAPTLELPLEQHDVTDLPGQLTDFARRGFDLGQGPLLRVGLFREAADQQVLLLVLHHTIADGRSVDVLLRELLICYRAFVDGAQPSLPSLPIRYMDYALWQQQFLYTPAFARQLEFWKRELAGAPALLNLPTDRPAPAAAFFNGALQTFSLDQTTCQALERFSLVHGLTLFTTLAAAFGILLSRYTRQKDLLVGIPPAGRTRRETEGLVGHFADALVLRFDFSHDLPVSAYVQRVRTALQYAFSHQDVPFEKVVEALQPERDPGRNPLVQVMLSFEKARTLPVDVAGLRVAPLAVQTNVSRVDLTLLFRETADGLLAGIWEYSTDLFDGTTLERLSAHYQIILQEMLAHPEAHLSELNILTPEERGHILGTWNDTRRELTEARLVHQLIEAQATANPQALALQTAAQEMTYAELNRRANQLARRLRRLGVGPESVVGVLVERSINVVLAELAILKAGGAFLPLDPAYPAERLTFMVRDSQAQLIISMVQLAGMPAPNLSLVDDWPTIARESDSDLENLAAPENMAYMIYTSGSTGQPKGVMIEHRNLCHILAWYHHAYSLAPGQRTGWLSSPSFDVSVFEIWPALTAGLTLVIVEDESRYDPAGLKTWLAEQRIRLNFVPTVVLETILDGDWPESLEYVLTGADKLTRRPPVGFGPRLVNHYGPTEITVLTSTALIEPGLGTDPPIGRPIQNTQLYIVDEHLNLVPPGVPGELCVGGLGLGRGYFTRPALTAEKFIPNPFAPPSSPPLAGGDRGGGRLYRTGDLCLFLPDGNIRFLGRLDRQVKIRGMRVELGEIKAALLLHAAVKDATVQVWEESHGGPLTSAGTGPLTGTGKRLAAYFIPQPGMTPSQAELRAFLKERLPGYMLPAVFIEMESWPTDANAKFDARALPAPQAYFSQQGAGEAPVTELQKVLHGIWCAMLGVREAGVNDNFFDLGGHSLLAMQLLGRIDSALGLRPPLGAFFQSPTLAGVAHYLETHREAQAQSALVAIRPEGAKPPIFFVHGALGTVLPFYELAARLDPSRPVYAFQTLANHQGSIETLANAYLVELRRIQPEGPYTLCGWSMGGLVAFEMGRQLRAAGQSDIHVIMLDSWRPAESDAFSEAASLREFALALLDQPLKPEPGSDDVDAWLEVVLAQGKSGKKLAESTPLEEIRRLYEICRNNVLAMLTYRPVAYPARFILLRAVDSHENCALTWADLHDLALTVHDVPGTHYTLLREPHVQVLAEMIDGFLE